MKVQLIRHATLHLEIGGQKLIIDPMLSSAGEMDPAPNAENQYRNPLTELPQGLPKLEQYDAIMVTHTHRDHFDEAAIKLLPKHMPLFCQPEDVQKITELGFKHVIPVNDMVTWRGICIFRTKGRHGRGEMEQKMGPVSGYVLEAGQEPVIYMTGDSIWCPEIEEAVKKYKPDITIAFAGAAQFLTGGTITMGVEDIRQLCQVSPETKIIAAHMGAWNHCLLTRHDLQEYVKLHHLSHQVLIPLDGEWLEFN
jgi:L-ascorbate metabolism protein UlaG (beta-lactamase superfamily)